MLSRLFSLVDLRTVGGYSYSIPRCSQKYTVGLTIMFSIHFEVFIQLR